MRKTMKNVLVATLVAGLCLSIVGIASAEEPTFDEIIVTPEEPTRQSEVTFTVDITGDDIEEVRLIYKECNDEFCHAKENISMAEDDGTWDATTTLEWDDTTYCDCWLVIKSNGTWYDYETDNSTWTTFTVVEGDDGTDGNGGNGGDGTDDTDGGTPGFELILVMISIIVALSIYKRKRK